MRPPARAWVLATFLAVFAWAAAGAADPIKPPPWPDAAMHAARFVRIGMDEGLSSLDVRSIAQDQQGFLWFGTSQAGLNRYDGREFRIYQNDPHDPASLAQNYIWSLLVDRHGVLWVGTAGGLDRYDRERDAFTHFRHVPGDNSTLPNNIVLCLFEDSGGDLWAGTRGGLCRFDRASGRFVTHRRPEAGSPSPELNSVRPADEMLRDVLPRTLRDGSPRRQRLQHGAQGRRRDLLERHGSRTRLVCPHHHRG